MTDTTNLLDPEEVKKKEWEEAMAAEAARQNLPPGGVPERRPQASIQPAPVHGEVHKRLEEAGSNLLGAPAMGKEAYDRANSNEQARKAAANPAPPEEYYPGAHCYIENTDDDGYEHHGRAVAVNRLLSRDKKGNPATYECSSRDGRAEFLVVNAEHLRKVSDTSWEKTQT